MRHDIKPLLPFTVATAGICVLLELVLFIVVVVPVTLISLPFVAITGRKAL